MKLIARTLMVLTLLAGVLLASSQAIAASPIAQQETLFSYEKHGLELDLGSLKDLKTVTGPSKGQLQGRWSGSIGETQLDVKLFFFGKGKFHFSEPRDVLNFMEFNLRSPDAEDGDGPALTFDESEFIEGSFGFVPVGWLGIHGTKKGTRITRHELHFCGLTKKIGYAVEVNTSKSLNPVDRPAILKWLRSCMQYDGPTRDANWTKTEAKSRWDRDAPDKVKEKSKFFALRTKYYLILTNVGKGTARGFGKKLDENYEIIRSVFPFEDIPEQRLLPIFYFVTPDQYHNWCSKVIGRPMSTSGGVATGDVYATYHQSINASVHIHEATHQIFKNRLFLGGGGSWFQEGVAEYISETANDVGSIKGLVKRNKHKPFREFFRLKSLLGDADTTRVSGGSDAHESYIQAAAIIEFARHSKFGRDKFLEFIHTTGAVPRRDLRAIEKSLLKVYEVDIKGFEEEFKKYWLKRKKRKKLKKSKKKKK